MAMQRGRLHPLPIAIVLALAAILGTLFAFTHLSGPKKGSAPDRTAVAASPAPVPPPAPERRLDGPFLPQAMDSAAPVLPRPSAPDSGLAAAPGPIAAPGWRNPDFPAGQFTGLPRRRSGEDTPGSTDASAPASGSRVACAPEGGKTKPVRLEGYRSGMTEIVEARDNANRIRLAPLAWTLTCVTEGAIAMIEAVGEAVFEGNERFQFRFQLRQARDSQSVELAEVRRVAGARRFQMVTLELRPNEQRRGSPIRGRIAQETPDSLRFSAEAADPEARSELSRLFQTSQWLDVPMRLDNKGFMLTVELPDGQALAAP